MSLRELARELASLGEATPGSRAEYEIVRTLSKHVNKMFSSYTILPIRVAIWSPGTARIYAGDKEYSATPLPPTTYAYIDSFHVSDTVTAEYVDSSMIEARYIRSAERDLPILIVSSRYYPLRIVMPCRPPLQTISCSSQPPAIAVSQKTMEEIKERRVSIEVASDLRRGYGYLLEAVLGNEHAENEVVIIAHHDHWFKGFRDNILGVIQALHLASKLGKVIHDRKLNTRVRFVSVTGHEFGSPILSSWYWSIGAQSYASMLGIKRAIDRHTIVLNLDTALPYSVKLAGSTIISSLLKDYINEEEIRIRIDFNDTRFDSYPFTSRGYLSLTLTGSHAGLEYIKHTLYDDYSEEVLLRSIKLVEALIPALAYVIRANEVVARRSYEFLRTVYESTVKGKYSLLTRRSLYKILICGKKIGLDATRTITLAKRVQVVMASLPLVTISEHGVSVETLPNPINSLVDYLRALLKGRLYWLSVGNELQVAASPSTHSEVYTRSLVSEILDTVDSLISKRLEEVYSEVC